MNLMALRQQKADLVAKARAIHNLAASQSRLTTTEEDAEFAQHMAAAAALDPKIDAAMALLDAERTAPAVDATAVGTAVSGSRITGVHDNAADRPWANVGEMMLAVRQYALTRGQTIDARLQAALGSGEAVDSEGGFLVAPEFAAGILQRTYEEGQVVSRCQRVPMSSNRLVLNGLDEDSRATGSRYGGIQVYRVAEAQAYTASKPKFKQITLNASKLIGLLYATDEILEDASALAAWASQNFPKAFNFQLDDEAINGTGAGQMLGVLSSGAAIVVAEESAQSAATVVTQNILKMFSRLWAPSRADAAWFINQDVEQQLYSLTLGSGTAVELLYTPAGYRGNGSKYGMMMGCPVIPIEQAATLGTQGDIVLADMTQYLIGERSGMRSDSSIHVQFLTGEQVFRWTLRNDGQPIPKKPLTPYKGSNTLSPFVTLATRA